MRAWPGRITRARRPCSAIIFRAPGLISRPSATATSVSPYPLLDRETRARLDAVLARWSEPPRRGRPTVLLHCDIAPGHLLFDPATGRLTGVINFGDIATGEPARDFIHVYEDYGPTILADVLSLYARDDAPSLLPEIRKWYLLEAISWTLEARAAGCSADVEHGLAEIERELTLLGNPTTPHS